MASLNPFRDINVTASETHYTFRSPSTPDAPALVVARPSGDIRLTDSPKLGGKRVTSIAGILGIIKLRLDKYIIIITKAQLVGRIRGHMVYKVLATEFLPMRERQLHDADEDMYLALLRTHLRTGPMYFSYTFDLTNSFQRQSTADLAAPLWQRADDRFFWNRYIASDLIDLRSSNPNVDPYILPTFFGFLTIATTAINSTPCTFILITRRSRHRAGTRYFTRGLDAAGNAGNFNETEQIVVLGDTAGGLGGLGFSAQNLSPANTKSSLDSEQAQVFSHVQTRGSIPVYWSELNTLKFTPTLQIKGIDHALPAARKHLSEHIRLYGETHLVNLINQNGRESHIKAAYESAVKSLTPAPIEHQEPSFVTPERFREIVPTGATGGLLDRLHYVYFDFHHECRNMQWHRAQLLLDKLPLGEHRYFHSIGSGQMASVKSWQTGVVRTNCMDCLDRTNVVQSIIARTLLAQQMVDAGVIPPGTTTAAHTAFETLFRNAWADNADAVSRAYSGTGALKTDYTRTGVRTRAGALADASNSITRYIRNNFADGPRQDAFDVFLGVHLPTGPLCVFADRRPLIVQAVPYLLAAAVFFLLAALLLPRGDGGGGGAAPVGVFALCWLGMGVWAAAFVVRFGVLYVRWPVLHPPQFCVEAVLKAGREVERDVVVGRWVGGGAGGGEGGAGGGGALKGHRARKSVFGIEKLEEGKKRIE
ncbi:SacI homology domain-containing protein [Morchella snyderi]|nr:SacI homology domain-containing protein [Morchella snyderi]